MLLLAFFAMPSSAFATWSVVAVDRSTGRVVIAEKDDTNGDSHNDGRYTAAPAEVLLGTLTCCAFTCEVRI